MDHKPSIVPIKSGQTRWWREGVDTIELFPDREGWTARVRRGDWGDAALVVDEHFASEQEAVAWCTRMAEVFAGDQQDDRDEDISDLSWPN